MQLEIAIHLDTPLNLPLAYHHMIQSALFHLMREENQENSFYHDGGASYGKREYRMFTFGLLKGRCRVEGKRITFFNQVSLEVRSMDIHCIQLIRNNLEREGIRLGDHIYKNVSARCKDMTVESDSLLIQMNSPICVYKTDSDSGNKVFWRPDQPEFAEYVNQNFIRKYTAAYGMPPEGGIVLENVKFNERDKYVTRYKTSYISGWRGVYRLSGKRKFLDFLYNTGLGSKNSQGFGLFEIMGE